MKKYMFFKTVISLALGMSLFVACGGDEPSTKPNSDSVVYGDSLYSWYLDKIFKEESDDTSAVEEPIIPADPTLLPPAGFYSAPFEIPEPAATMNGKIFCSLDGSEDYDEISWPVKVSSNMVVRCIERIGENISRKSDQTYFIGETVSMPVVAISGFYSYNLNTKKCEGQDPYGCRGLMDEWEAKVHVEYFEKGSRSSGKAWEVDAGISFMGNYSRTYPKKPVGIKIKKQYNEKKLKYSFFAARPEKNKFRGFNLRNSGNRYVGDYIGDPSMTAIVEGSSVDYQRSRQVVVFYNGEYYGIHDLRERLNEHFVETNYGIDNNTVEMIKQKNDTVTAVAGTGEYYKALLEFVANNDFSGENNKAYDSVQTMMDVGNYADYIAAQFYLMNADWPSNNVRAWRAPGQPFKFILFDTDQSLGWSWVSEDFKMNIGGMFGWIKNDRTSALSTKPGRTSPGYFANIYKQISKNPDFQRMFINHGAVMMNEYLTEERLAASVAAQNAMIPDDEIKRDQTRFIRQYSPYGNEKGHFDERGVHILEGAIGRNRGLRNEYRKEFSLGEDIQVTVAAEGNGSVTIDGMKLPRVNYTGTFFGGNPMLLKAEEKTGTFVEWEDGSKENPRLVMPEDGSKFVAKFK